MNVSLPVIISIIALGCTILGAAIGYLTFIKKLKDDAKREGKEEGEESKKGIKVALDLEYIKKGIDEIRLDNKENDRKISNIIERMVKVEESTKSAHKRIDHIEEGV